MQVKITPAELSVILEGVRSLSRPDHVHESDLVMAMNIAERWATRCDKAGLTADAVWFQEVTTEAEKRLARCDFYR